MGDQRDPFEVWLASRLKAVRSRAEIAAPPPPVRTGPQRQLALRRPVWISAATIATVVAASAVTVSLVSNRVVAPTTAPSFHPAPSASSLPTPVVGTPVSITNLHMFGPASGWAQRQMDGALLHTRDGVQRWSPASPPLAAGQPIIAVAFVDANVARALFGPVAPGSGPGGPTSIVTWRTDDGGTTWVKEGSFQAYASPNSPSGTLDFVDGQHGWFSQSGGALGSSPMDIFRTVDGGAHWTHVEHTSLMGDPPAPGSLPTECDKNPASFIDATTGWVTAQCNGGSSFLYVTRDGGTSWTSQSLHAPPPGGFGYDTIPPEFTSSRDGSMVGFVGVTGQPRATLFVTADAGATWLPRPVPDLSVQAWSFIDATNGWLLTGAAQFGETNRLLATRDAGRSWADLHVVTNLSGLKLEFVTHLLGWSFASDPVPSPAVTNLLQTRDGGRSWTPVRPVLIASR